MRQIILDTETTGLDPRQGHRIIEIGCVELLDRRLTDHHFHVYLNPERKMDAAAIEVHGITQEFLADKPRFAEVAGAFMQFVQGAELIIHNAPFDVGFLNHELGLLEQAYPPLQQYCTVLDTLVLARKKHPGQRNSLDALCKRYHIDNSHRQLHGALLDSEILADVYLRMTGGQIDLAFDSSREAPETVTQEAVTQHVVIDKPKLKVLRCNTSETEAHRARLHSLNQASGGRCLWDMK